MIDSEKTKDTKEDFCGLCATVPLALLGAGVSAVGSKQDGAHKKKKKIMFWGGLVTAIISILAALWFLFTCSDCR